LSKIAQGWVTSKSNHQGSSVAEAQILSLECLVWITRAMVDWIAPISLPPDESSCG